jgi:hypothetical protein
MKDVHKLIPGVRKADSSKRGGGTHDKIYTSEDLAAAYAQYREACLAANAKVGGGVGRRHVQAADLVCVAHHYCGMC